MLRSIPRKVLRERPLFGKFSDGETKDLGRLAARRSRLELDRVLTAIDNAKSYGEATGASKRDKNHAIEIATRKPRVRRQPAYAVQWTRAEMGHPYS